MTTFPEYKGIKKANLSSTISLSLSLNILSYPPLDLIYAQASATMSVIAISSIKESGRQSEHNLAHQLKHVCITHIHLQAHACNITQALQRMTPQAQSYGFTDSATLPFCFYTI